MEKGLSVNLAEIL